MDFRPITDLADDEIQEVVRIIEGEKAKILNISRDKERDSITLVISNIWGEKGEELEEIADNYVMDYDELTCNEVYDHKAAENKWKYQQWLLAKGCNLRLKDNPFFKK